MAFYDAFGRTDYFMTFGEGRPVLLLHGISNSGRAWNPQIPALVAAGHQVIVPDLAGHGASGRVTNPMSVDALAADVERLLNTLGIAELDVLGLSMGGMIALELALRGSVRIGRLIVANSFDRTATSAFQEIADGWARTFEQPHGPVLRLEQSWPFLVSPEFQASPEGMRTYQIWHGIAATSDGRSLAQVARGITTFDAVDRLADLTMPVLFIAGELDRMSPADLSREMAARVPKGQYACIGNAGHISNADSPAAFSELLVSFLSAR